MDTGLEATEREVNRIIARKRFIPDIEDLTRITQQFREVSGVLTAGVNTALSRALHGPFS